MDWLDLLAVQGNSWRVLSQESSPTPQFKSINSSALSFHYSPTNGHSYMTTGKTIALTRWTFVDKVMSLLFNILSRLVIALLPRSEQASFNFMAAVTICSDIEAQKNKISVSIVFASVCHEMMGPDAMILVF